LILVFIGSPSLLGKHPVDFQQHDHPLTDRGQAAQKAGIDADPEFRGRRHHSARDIHHIRDLIDHESYHRLTIFLPEL